MNSKRCYIHIMLSLFSPSRHPSSLLLPAAPGPGGYFWSVSDSTLCHCGISGNGTMDQRWPGTGWRERPTRYYYFLSSYFCLPRSFFCCFLCVLLQSMPGLIRNLPLSNVGVLHKSMFREQCTADRSGCCLHSPNFNLLLSILRVLWEDIINWLLSRTDI